MQDVEAIVHAGCQQEVLMGWVPLQPPHAAAHASVAKRLPHVPAVPQQHVLIVAAARATRDIRQQVQKRRDLVDCAAQWAESVTAAEEA